MKKNELIHYNKNIEFRNKALSTHSKKAYTIAIKSYYQYLATTKQTECTESVLSFLEIEKNRLRPTSYNLTIQALKEFLLKKHEDNIKQLIGITETFKKVKRAKVKKEVLEDGYLTIDEIKDICKKLTSRLSLIVQALFLTGLRIEELLSIRLKDIAVNEKAIIKVRAGKGMKEHTAYLPLNVYEKIIGTFQGNTFLYETQGNKKYHQSNIRKELKRQGNNIGYNLYPHLFRHSKGMYLKDVKGLSADMIAKALNHANVKTTLEHYFHGSPSAEDLGVFDWEL